MGYERYFVAHIRKLLRQFRLVEVFSDFCATGRNNNIVNIPTFIERLAYFSHAGIRSRRILWRCWFLRDKPSAIAEVRNYAKAMASPFSPQKFELDTANLATLLRFEDNYSMSQSIETRLPMLDLRLVVFGCSLPVEQKMHDGWRKYILCRGIEGRVSDPICWRNDEMGFVAPQSSLTKKHNEKMQATIRISWLLRELVDLKGLENSGFAIDRASLWRLYSAGMLEESLSISSLS